MCALHTQNELSLSLAHGCGRERATPLGRTRRPPGVRSMRALDTKLYNFLSCRVGVAQKDIASFIMRLMAINFAGRSRLAVSCLRMLSPAWPTCQTADAEK